MQFFGWILLGMMTLLIFATILSIAVLAPG